MPNKTFREIKGGAKFRTTKSRYPVFIKLKEEAHIPGRYMPKIVNALVITGQDKGTLVYIPGDDKVKLTSK